MTTSSSSNQKRFERPEGEIESARIRPYAPAKQNRTLHQRNRRNTSPLARSRIFPLCGGRKNVGGQARLPWVGSPKFVVVLRMIVPE